MVTFENIDDDCLFHILGHLPLKSRIQCETVSKRWRTVFQRTWKTVRSVCIRDHFRSACSVKLLSKIDARCGNLLTELSFADCEPRNYLTRELAQYVADHFPSLYTLHIDVVDSTIDNLVVLFNSDSNLGAKLESLTLRFCSDDNRKRPHKSQARKISFFSITGGPTKKGFSHVDCVLREVFVKLAHGGDRLKLLNLLGWTNVNKPGFELLPKSLECIDLSRSSAHLKSVEDLLTNQSRLTHFSMAQSPWHHPADTAKVIKLIIQHSPQIAHINVAYNAMVDNVLKLLGKMCLRSLNLTGCSFDPTAVQSLIASGTCTDSLQSLYIARAQIGGGAFTRLVRFTKLRDLDLTSVSCVNDASISTLVPQLPLLECIRMHCCRRIGDETMITLGLHCKNLRLIDITMCRNVTNAGIEQFLANFVNGGQKRGMVIYAKSSDVQKTKLKTVVKTKLWEANITLDVHHYPRQVTQSQECQGVPYGLLDSDNSDPDYDDELED